MGRGNDKVREMEIARRVMAMHPHRLVRFPRNKSVWYGDLTIRLPPIDVYDNTLLDIGGGVGVHDVLLMAVDLGSSALPHPETLPPPTMKPRCWAVVTTRQIERLEDMPNWADMQT